MQRNAQTNTGINKPLSDSEKLVPVALLNASAAYVNPNTIPHIVPNRIKITPKTLGKPITSDFVPKIVITPILNYNTINIVVNKY